MLVCSTSQRRLVLAGVVLLGSALGCGSAGDSPVNESADGSSNPPLEDGGRGVGDSSVTTDGAQGQVPVTESKQAKDILESLRTRFYFRAPQRTRHLPTRPLLRGTRPLFVDGSASGFVAHGATITPDLPSVTADVRRAKMEFPKASDGFVRLTDEKSGAWLEAKLVVSTPIQADVADGYLLLRDAMGKGNHILQRPFSRGYEDYVVFEHQPALEHIDYALRLGEEIGDLRILEGGQTFEALDASGTPRFHAAPPFLLSEGGRVTPASFSLHDCAANTSPAAPWRKRPIAAGARQCTLTVSWHSSAFPAVLDPGFSTTGSMIVPRMKEAMTVLPSGTVLVAGGNDYNGIGTTVTELYDPVTGTWAATGSLSLPRTYTSATTLEDGRVLVPGGWLGDEGYEVASAELYQPSTGTWQATGSMPRPHDGHTATRLHDGRVLIAGGWINNHAAIFDPRLESWSDAGTLSAIRWYSTAAQLQDGRVLIVGGEDSGAEFGPYHTTDQVDVFNPASGTFTAAGSLAGGGRGYHGSASLPSGKVLVSGGWRTPPSTFLDSNEIYDPVTNAFQVVAPMSTTRTLAPSAFLPPNSFLSIGGGNETIGFHTAESYSVASDQWQDAGSVSWFPSSGSAVTLRDGRVLVAGGFADEFQVAADAAIFEPAPDPGAGATCGDGVRAASGEECDLGISNGARATCSAQCRVQDLRAIDDPLPTTNRWRTLGAGRHPITGYDTGAFGTAFVEVNDGVPSVRVTGVQLNGIPSDRAVTVGEGPSILLGSDPVIAGVGGAISVVAYTDRNADGDLLGVALRRVHPFGEWVGPVVWANTTTDFSQFDPDILWTGSELIVAWSDDSNLSTGPDIRYRIYDASLTPKPTLDGPASAEGTLSAAPEPEQDVVLSRFGTSWAAAWRSFSAGSETIRVHTESADWSVGPFLPGPASQKPALTELDATHLLLVYTEGTDLADSGTPSDGQIRASILERPTGGMPSSLVVAVLPMSNRSRTEPSLDGRGSDLWLAWRELSAPADHQGETVLMTKLTWNSSTESLGTGEVLFPIPRASTHEIGDQRRPALAIGKTLNTYEAASLMCAWDDLATALGGLELVRDVAFHQTPLPMSRLP